MNDKAPPYASTIITELWIDGLCSTFIDCWNQAYVVIKYNDEINLIPGDCTDSKHGGCAIEEWWRNLKMKIIIEDEKERDRICKYE